jgi:hypothetical protein
MGIDPMNNISIIIRILFAVTIFQHRRPEAWSSSGSSIIEDTRRQILHFGDLALWKVLQSEIYPKPRRHKGTK